ncbi:MAG: hypothetical protein GY832_41925 [Chloroflexi bacterium]|nr:hypothetical protein [Chloroflexota bacterium]
MVQIDAQISNVETSGPFVRVIFIAPTLCAGLTPGRFALADLGEHLCTPIFAAWADPESFEILVSPDHPAAALRSGMRVNLIGPLGRGFEVPAPTRRLLLVADTVHLPVLLPLAQPGNQFPSTALLLSATTSTDLYLVHMLPPTLEVHLVTADGSALDLFSDLVRWADCVCVASAPSSYPKLAEIVQKVRIRPDHHFAQVLVIPSTVCGVGACQSCAVEVARGTKLACTNGPVFNLNELRF